MKAKLDAAVVAAAECPPGMKRQDIWCTHCKGMVLEVRPAGKTYYARYTDQNGKQKAVKIARADQISFDQARKKARQLLAEAALGQDPAAAKKERREVPVFEEVAKQHVEHARTYMRSIKTLEGYMKRITKKWGKVRLTDIKQQDVAAWFAELREQGLAPATVLKTRVVMNRTFELAARWGIAGADKNPIRGIPQPRFSNARERFVDSEEAARLLAAAAKSRNPQLPAIIGLLLLTGMRVSELLSARWKDVDVGRRSWFIPTSKTGRHRHVPLSQAAVDVIERLSHPEGAVFLFPSPRDPKKHLSTIKHGWQSAREEAGMPDLRIHDLRHSAASFMINAGVDLYSVGKVLGHASHASTARYSHVANSTLLNAVEAGAAKLNLQTL